MNIDVSFSSDSFNIYKIIQFICTVWTLLTGFCHKLQVLIFNVKALKHLVYYR